MSNEQELYTLRALAEQAQNPNADVQQIMQHLHANMEAMSNMQQQLGSLQATVHEQAQHQDSSTPNSSPITSLTAAIQAMAAQQHEQQQIHQRYQHDLQQVLNGLAQRASPTSRAPVPPPLSPKFKGTGEFTFAEFSSKLVTMQSRYPDSLKTDVDKINYALQSLEGVPALYFAPYVNGQVNDDEDILTSYPTFLKVLDEMYGDQHNLDEVHHLLNRLRQSGPMTEYIAKFRSLSGRSGWNDVSLLSRFKEGLSDEIKSMLTPQWHTLTNLRLAQSAATSAYQNLQAQHKFRTRHNSFRPQYHPQSHRRHPAPVVASSPATPAATAMDLDAMRVKHITADEKQRRRDNGLCLYCGGANHFASSCPVKRARLAQVIVESDSENDLA